MDNMRAKYETLSAAVLKDLAKARNIKGISRAKKEELIEAMLRQDELDASDSHVEKKSEEAEAPQPRRRGRRRNDAAQADTPEPSRSEENVRQESEGMKKENVLVMF